MTTVPIVSGAGDLSAVWGWFAPDVARETPPYILVGHSLGGLSLSTLALAIGANTETSS